MTWPWSELGLSGPADLRAIRRAYAQRLNTTHPEDDPEGFQRLHAAYQEASRQARGAAPQEAAEPAPHTAWKDEPVREQAEPWSSGGPLEPPDAPEPPPERGGEPDWDYERLFAEGEAEAREARRRDNRREAKSGWRSDSLRRKALILVCFAAVFLTAGWAVSLRTARREAQRLEELLPQWLEEDYGEPFIHAVSNDIFAPAADPELYFHASAQGERSDHWPGYQTNYPQVLVKRALEDFARERELDLDLAAYSHHIGDAPGSYLFNLPLLGAEEDISALGTLLEDLARQEWYLVPVDSREAEEPPREPVSYTVYLCHRGLAFYEGSQDFQAEEALALYAQAGPAFCRYILDNSGLADRHLGEGTYVLQDREAVELADGIFFQVLGADRESGQVRVQYLLDSGGGALFCIPAEKMGGIRSIIDLYRGTPRPLQLDKAGIILVTDQVPEE